MSRSTRLWIVLGLNLALVGVLAAVGIGAHSLGVMAEGADYLADAAAIGVALLAIRLSGLPPTVARPHGYPMATTWAALVNAGWLLVLSVLLVVTGAAVYLTAGGFLRLVSSEDIGMVRAALGRRTSFFRINKGLTP